MSKTDVRTLLAAWLLCAVACVGPSRESGIRAELGKDMPQLPLRDVTSLLDSVLPELEIHFAERAAGHPWLFGHLLARYATRIAVKNVRRIYVRDHTQWGCDSRYPLLAYLLRVNRPEGTREFRRALQDREGNGCFRWMLWAIPRLVAAPELESVAIDTLADADAEVAATAAQFLSRQGSAAAEAHLWRWLEEVGGKDRTRRCPAKRINRWSGLVFRSSVCEKDAPVLRTLMYDVPRFEVGWYHPDTLELLRAKVAQFPLGATFGWCTQREGGGELDRRQADGLREIIRQVVESLGYRFLRDPPSGSCSSDAAWMWNSGGA
ncbi:MAG TPA: hypothetical protein VER03_14705 [Bryobacteraceae bacterium]|nr:hypothetical protein [Bryobacteraceae bacterium]